MLQLASFLIWYIRQKNLETLVNCPTSSPHVHSISKEMLEKLNEIFGNGIEGTVAAATLLEGPRRRPRGIPILVLIAPLLDPGTKGGVGIPNI